MKKTMLLLAVITASFGMTSCGGEQAEKKSPSTTQEVQPEEVETHGQAGVNDSESRPNILNIAIGSPDHTTLVAAVQAAGIEDVLVNSGPLTVFAPNNAAFDKLPAGTVEELVKPENKAKLAGILTMHAAPGTFNEKQLRKEARKGRKIYMADGSYLSVVVDENDDIFVGGAKVLGYVDAGNGVVVVVDSLVDSSK